MKSKIVNAKKNAISLWRRCITRISTYPINKPNQDRHLIWATIDSRLASSSFKRHHSDLTKCTSKLSIKANILLSLLFCLYKTRPKKMLRDISRVRHLNVNTTTNVMPQPPCEIAIQKQVLGFLSVFIIKNANCIFLRVNNMMPKQQVTNRQCIID